MFCFPKLTISTINFIKNNKQNEQKVYLSLSTLTLKCFNYQRNSKRDLQIGSLSRVLTPLKDLWQP